MTPVQSLFAAASSCDLVALEKALEEGAPLNAQNDAGQTALMIAILKKDDKTVETLIGRGASINLTDHYQNSALHHAYLSANMVAVKLLKENGADEKQENVFGYTPWGLIILLHTL